MGEGNVVLSQMLHPRLQKRDSVSLSESSDVRNVTSTEQHIADEVDKLFFEYFDCLSPTKTFVVETINELFSTSKLNLGGVLRSVQIFKGLLRLFVVKL